MRKWLLLMISTGILSACSTGNKSMVQSNLEVDKIETGRRSEVSSREEEEMKIKITVNQSEFWIIPENNAASQAFISQLPLEINMEDVNGNEKFFLFDQIFPTEEIRPGQIQSGDLMLYGDSGLVLFYKDFISSYSYTRLGKMENTTGLEQVLGRGTTKVVFEVE